MASLRRSKTMPADGQTAQFLYTIIKQLDLKSIDWSVIATQLNITNGHAARMRFSRFKQHMEGTPTVPRAARPKKSKQDGKGGKGDNPKKRGLDEMRSGEDDNDGEFGPKLKVKREDNTASASQSLVDGDNNGANSTADPTATKTGAAMGPPIPVTDGAAEAINSLSVKETIEKGQAIKLENEELGRVKVKFEPLDKENVEIKAEH